MMICLINCSSELQNTCLRIVNMNTVALDTVDISYRQLNYFSACRPTIQILLQKYASWENKNNGSFMVSIHMVSVSVQLIISLVYFIFRFKREALHCRSLHVLRLLELPCKSERATSKPHAVSISTTLLCPKLPLVYGYTNGLDTMRAVYITTKGHSPLLCF